MDHTAFLQPPPRSSHGTSSAQPPNPFDSPNLFNLAKTPDAASTHSRSASNTPVSPLPPTLPPIPRIASVYDPQSERPTTQHSLNTKEDGRDPESNEPKTYQSASQDASTTRLDQRDFQPATYRPRDDFHTRRTSQEERDHIFPRRPNTAGQVTGLRSRGLTAYQPTNGYPADIDMTSAPIYKVAPIISIPTGPMPHFENLSPSKFPSESHRVPPAPPQAAGSSPSPRIPQVAVPQTQRIEKVEKYGKKLNLRNPMSLLLRRRSGQVLEQLSDESLISHRTPGVHGSLMADNFDPSIRGKIVHDFSAPRPRRNFPVTSQSGDVSSMNKSSAHTSNEQLLFEGNDPSRIERQHTPVFKEHLEDDENQQVNDSAIRAEALANKDFIARNSFPPLLGQDIVPGPSFTRLSKPLPEPPQEVQEQEQRAASTASSQHSDIVAPIAPLSPVAEDGTTPTDNASARTTSTNRPRARKALSSASRSTVSMRGSRTSTSYDWQNASLPPHMLSNSSRFSFQLANASATQERILEERHKQKEAAKALEQHNRRFEEDASDEGDDYDLDDFDENGYDGFEEDVPTVGEEWSHSGLGLNGLSLPGLSLREAAKMALGSNPVDQFGSMPVLPAPIVQGLGIMPALPEHIQGSSEPHKSVTEAQEVVAVAESRAAVGSQFVDDDLYFDDGEFGDLDVDLDGDEPFDESVFDDPLHPLYERKHVHRPETDENARDGAAEVDTADRNELVAPQNSQRAARRSRLGLVPSEPMPQHPDLNSSQETITAYHQALASAANKAAEDGRFRRQSSVDISDSELSHLVQSTLSAPPTDEDDNGVTNISSRPSLVPDDSTKHNSQATSSFSPVVDQLDGTSNGFAGKSVGFSLPNIYDDGFGYSSDFDYSDYDSALEDDPIIAAANAEALANDDEGIYGREFDFYAKPAPSSTKDGEAVFFQGGYFGPKDWAEIKRQRSTREPNLTPITERSEYSTRNSYVSLHIPDHRASMDRGQPSPGLAALARMSPGWESDNMEALLKLRRAAFGGSQGSLVSGGNASSPMTSPIVGKGEARAMWSSPISREISGEDGIEEELDSDLLDEANYADDDEDEEYADEHADEVDQDVEEAISPASSYSDEGDAANSPTQRATLGSDSPTIRSSLLLPSSAPSSPSPTSQPRLELPPSSPPVAPATLQAPLSSPPPIPVFSMPFTPPSPAAAGPALGAPASPVSPLLTPGSSTERRAGHSRSGSDSVAYVRERDGGGLGFRWVLERRRTGEDGGVEIVGREVVQGGRI